MALSRADPGDKPSSQQAQERTKQRAGHGEPEWNDFSKRNCFPVDICSLNNRFHILQLIVRIGGWDRACVRIQLLLSRNRSLLRLEEENQVVTVSVASLL